jgi:hypothetical protein
MSIITRTRPPVKPTRKFPRPDRPFGEGIFTRRMPYTAADLAWAAVELNKDATDFDVALEEELEWPGSRSEYEAWLDQIAPTREELEARDRFDAFLGHDD